MLVPCTCALLPRAQMTSLASALTMVAASGVGQALAPRALLTSSTRCSSLKAARIASRHHDRSHQASPSQPPQKPESQAPVGPASSCHQQRSLFPGFHAAAALALLVGLFLAATTPTFAQSVSPSRSPSFGSSPSTSATTSYGPSESIGTCEPDTYWIVEDSAFSGVHSAKWE